MESSVRTTPQVPTQKWLVLILVCLGNFVATLDTGIVNLSFPVLTGVFNTDPNTVLWVSVAYFLTVSGLMQVFGKLADTFDSKKVYIWGFILFTVGLILCAVAQSISQLILFRVVQGVGIAMIFAVGNAILTYAFPDEERGKAMGIASGVVGAGLFVGPALGGIMLDALGWQSIFYLRIPVGLAGIVMSLLILKSQKLSRTRKRFDFPGAALQFLALSSLLLAINRGGILGWSSVTIIGLFFTSAAVLGIFVLVERRTTNPVVNLALFRSRHFTAANVGNMLRFMAVFANNFLTPFYLLGVLGFTPTRAGLVFAIVPVMILLTSPVAGWLSDKIGSRPLCAGGMVCISVGLFLLSRLQPDSTVAHILPILALMGLGSGLFESPNHNAVMGAVPRSYLGMASATIATFRSMGQSMGLAIAGIVFVSRQAYYAAVFAGQGIDPQLAAGQAYHRGIVDGFLVGTVIALAGLAASLLMEGKRQRGH
jgi:EmrB/QacA subfamily drug resistance transporter